MNRQEQLKTILQNRFGFENFHQGQLEAICVLVGREVSEAKLQLQYLLRAPS